MVDLKIRVFKSGEADAATTVTIPGGVLKVKSKLIPQQATSALQEKSIDLDEIIKLSENPDARGTLVEVEEHEKNEKVVIAGVADATTVEPEPWSATSGWPRRCALRPTRSGSRSTLCRSTLKDNGFDSTNIRQHRA